MIQFNGFNFGKLELLSKDIDHPVYGIPKKYGIYQWVYWPEFDENNISNTDLIDLLVTYSTNNFCIEEELIGTYKFQAKIWEQGFKENDNMFGLSAKKNKELTDFLATRSNIVLFSTFFQEICFVKPFYLGKANNLQQRLTQHFNGSTNVMQEIRAKGIPEKDIWVGYRETPQTSISPNINTIFEEIYSRRVKPGLSIKPN